MELKEFTRKHPLKIEILPAPENPTMDNSDDMDHWYITLTNEERNSNGLCYMKLYFSQGSGHRTPTPKLMPRTLADHEYNARCKPTKPELEDILDCLASDCAAVENARGFEEFASEFGYDVDSRRAKRTYDTCMKQSTELFDLLGRDAYDLLLWETERL